VQNAGSPAAGTGLNKSAIIEKISLKEAAAVSDQRNASGKVQIVTVNAPAVINPNGMPKPMLCQNHQSFLVIQVMTLTQRSSQAGLSTRATSSGALKAKATTCPPS
jgi:hypothetical protein